MGGIYDYTRYFCRILSSVVHGGLLDNNDLQRHYDAVSTDGTFIQNLALIVLITGIGEFQLNDPIFYESFVSPKNGVYVTFIDFGL